MGPVNIFVSPEKTWGPGWERWATILDDFLGELMFLVMVNRMLYNDDSCFNMTISAEVMIGGCFFCDISMTFEDWRLAN
jgi:hypothetical protein